jgi:HPr kinase/phosphorylase
MGKLECAVELVKRGYKFVADDVVNIVKRSGNNLIGSSLEITKNLIEVKGIGIIDIKDIFGIGNILDKTNIELVIKFEEWKYVKEYDRLGIDETYTEILKVRVPEVRIPVGPSRNLAVLVETASLNQRLKNKGHFTARDLNDRLLKEINK